MTDHEGRVALVLVSHSKALAEGVAALARQMVGGGVNILCAAGAGDDGSKLGTDATRILETITTADNPAGTIVFMDLGSAILSTEMALDLAAPPIKERVALSPAPFVEGVLVAAVAAAAGASRTMILGEALHALAPKAEHLGPPATPDAAGFRAPETSNSAASAAGLIAEAVIRDPHGLHARPAGQIAALAANFRAEITLADLDNGKGPADALSLIALLSLSVRPGHRLRIVAKGPNAQEAALRLRALIEGFSGNQAAEAVPGAAASPKSPIPLSPGIAIGELFEFRRSTPPIPEHKIEDAGAELARLENAVDAVAKDLEGRHGSGIGAEMAAMQARLLRDPMISATARQLVTRDHLNAAVAFSSAANEAAKIYQTLEDPYLRAREADLREVTQAVIGKLLGASPASLPDGPVILLADELATSDVLGLDRDNVLGVIDRQGGPTSHAAILLRGLGIPAIGGAGTLISPTAKRAAFDGATAEIVVDPTPDELVSFGQRRQAWLARRARSGLTQGRATTADGVPVEIWANVASLTEARAGRDAGACGIGLLRTEMMFLDRVTTPSEDEQVEQLKEMFGIFAGRPIIVRTLDAGGDKPVPYMNMPKEANPYLGVRGLRLSLRETAIFETQLRAILRAGAGHDLRIMLPMVTEPSELEAARAALMRAHVALERDGLSCAWPCPLGIMIEVPSAALMARQLGRVCDFFSIGTNDLTQYALAAERGNPALRPYADPAHPAVLSLVTEAVSGAEEAGIPISVCGEAAGDETVALLLAGLGIRKLSMAPGAIPFVAARLAEVDLATLSRAAADAIKTGAAREARWKVARSVSGDAG
jgi:phosphocarrier protein FPr